MREFFPSFYPPTAQEYDTLWKNGLVVLDANVLLDLYRLPANARDELLQVLDDLGERLWIPYQVALEFQRNRLSVIAEERNVTKEALDSAKSLVDSLSKQVLELQLDKHGLGLEPDALLKDLSGATDKLTTALEAVHDARLDPGQADSIRDRLDQILKNKIGQGPQNQADLDALTTDGDQRFSEKIPPGFSDKEKGRDPKAAQYFHNAIRYQAKFGDLIVWRQLIIHVKDKNIKQVLLVTRDKKEDWWWIEKGKRIGPNPELVTEIRRETDVDLFWIYRPDQFLEMAKTYANAKVSASSVDELKALQPRSSRARNLLLDASLSHFTNIARPLSESRVEDMVLAYLEDRFEKLEINQSGFPDAFILDSGSRIAVEVQLLGRIGSLEFTEKAKSSIVVGNEIVTKGSVDDFLLVCVLPPEITYDFTREDELLLVEKQLRDALRDFPIREVIVGSIKKDTFEPLLLLAGHS